jgi:type VI protein secretion system component VasK
VTDDQAEAKTVIRPAVRGADPAAWAAPLLELGRSAARSPRPDPAALAAELRARVEAFEAAAAAGGVRPETIRAARNALVALADARARANPALDAARWRRAAAWALPAASPKAIRAEAALAAARGERDAARFLGHCLEALEGVPARPRPARRRAAPLAVAAFLAALVFWAGWTEWRHRERLLAELPTVAETVAAGQGAAPVRAARLDVFAAAVERVERASAGSPLGLASRLPFADPGTAARARYAEVAAALAVAPVAEALAVALATEGDADALYDTLRAVAVLERRADWRPRFLAGWILARGEAFPGLAGLAPHLLAMTAPPDGLEVSDPQTLAEAQRFASDGNAAARAYLELERSEAAGALPRWSPDAAAPGLAAVLTRRSGLPVEAGPSGLHTAAGWAMARTGGAAAAVERAAAEEEALLGAGRPADVEATLDILQARTLDAWSDYVADLRVRPFTDQPTAAFVSGSLGARDSPLAALIRDLWRQVGGEDRGRSHANQLRIAAAFGPAIQFVEQGRMTEIARLFASLNVALQSVRADADLAATRLMDVQARAASIAALNHAPRLVVEIVEDVLAQTAVSSAGLLGDPSVRLWRSDLGPACAAAVDGRFPFGDGADAEIEVVAELLGPEGVVPRFFSERLAGRMDMSEAPWRWKPEARLSGLQHESASFFQRIAALGPAVFAHGLGSTPITLSALAQRGAPTVAIGGVAAPVVTTGDAVTLEWPGPAPASGFEIAFDSGERAGAAGPWGLLRYLDELRLRPRLDGRRFLLDVRLADARAYIQMDFEDARNPVAARSALRGLSCPLEL